LQVTPQLCVSGLQAAVPFPFVGPGQTEQLGPHACAVSAEHALAVPHAFCPTGQTHALPFWTKVGSHAKPHAPAVQVPAACGGTVELQFTQLRPHVAGASAEQVVAPPQAFVPLAQTQAPPTCTNPGLQANPHWPEVQVGDAFAGAVHAVQFGPQRAGVSGLQVVSTPHTFVFAPQTQAPPLEMKLGSHWNPQAPLEQVAAECGGAVHGVQLAPHTTGVSAVHVAG
jgi:hypothetical protein